MTTLALDRTFSALGDPVRRSIVRDLIRRPATVREISHPYDISRPAVSKHLRVLRDAGIVECERVGRQNWYSVRDGAFDEATEWLDEVQAMWGAALTALKSYVEEETHGDDQ